MTPEALREKITSLSMMVVSDPRWSLQKDDLGVSILGVILYGYAMGVGRMIMMLEQGEIESELKHSIIGATGSTETWTQGLVEEARKSFLDPNYHPGQTELIGIGHSYMGLDNLKIAVDNIFANLESFRSG